MDDSDAQQTRARARGQRGRRGRGRGGRGRGRGARGRGGASRKPTPTLLANRYMVRQPQPENPHEQSVHHHGLPQTRAQARHDQGACVLCGHRAARCEGMCPEPEIRFRTNIKDVSTFEKNPETGVPNPACFVKQYVRDAVGMDSALADASEASVRTPLALYQTLEYLCFQIVDPFLTTISSKSAAEVCDRVCLGAFAWVRLCGCVWVCACVCVCVCVRVCVCVCMCVRQLSLLCTLTPPPSTRTFCFWFTSKFVTHF